MKDILSIITIPENNFVGLPEITNEVLRASIIEYVTTPNSFGNTRRNLVYMESFISGDTTIYRFFDVFDMNLFVGLPNSKNSPNNNIMTILKLDSIYIGYRNLDNSDIAMSIETMVGILSKDFPEFKERYALYLYRKEYNKRMGLDNGAFPLGAFSTVLGRSDIWTLKFVDGHLVSRSAYLVLNSSTRYF